MDAQGQQMSEFFAGIVCGMQMISLTVERSKVDQELFLSAVWAACTKFARWFMNNLDSSRLREI